MDEKYYIHVRYISMEEDTLEDACLDHFVKGEYNTLEEAVKDADKLVEIILDNDSGDITQVLVVKVWEDDKYDDEMHSFVVYRRRIEK